MIAVLAVWLPLMGAVGSGDAGPVLVGILPVLLLAAVPVAIWLSYRFSLASAVVVLENAGPVTALRRSVALVRGAWWRIFGITILGAMLAGAISWVIQLPFNIVGFFAVIPAVVSQPAHADGPSAGLVTAMVAAFLLMFIGGVVSQVFQIGFTQLVSALLYVDQRIRREGLAEAILADLAAARPGTDPTPPVPPTAPQPDGPSDGR